MKKEILVFLGYTLFLFILYLVVTQFKYMYASTIDYTSQHIVFPEYLRSLFYETKQLFPDFSFNIGGGQNIYNIAYYGLFSPFYALSYFLPFVNMYSYTTTMIFIFILTSSILLFYYLKQNGNSFLVCSLGGLVLLTSCGLTYHSHKHIMFCNYMPFIIMGMFGVDRYIEKNKPMLLVSSLILILLTSFYFAIPAYIILFIFLIYKKVSFDKNITKEKIVKFILKSGIYFGISGFICSILVFPTFYTLLSGRSTPSEFNVLTLLIPIPKFLYNTSSMGITMTIVLSSLLVCFKADKKDKIFTIILLLICSLGVVKLILNGFMYTSDKVLIPITPIFIFMSCKGLTLYFNYVNEKIKRISIIYIVASTIIISLFANSLDTPTLRSEYNEGIEINKKIFNEINKDDSYYRINNQYEKIFTLNPTNTNVNYTSMYSSVSNYHMYDFISNILNNDMAWGNKLVQTASSNIFSQVFFGEKYIISDYELGLGYEFMYEYGDIYLYENINYMPIGYASNNFINKNEYMNLNSFDRNINLIGNIVYDGDTTTPLAHSNIYNINDILTEDISKLNKGLHEFDINMDLSNKILFINFDIEDKPYTQSITINNVTNVLGEENTKYYNDNNNMQFIFLEPTKLQFDLSHDINLSNIKIGVIDYDVLKNRNSVDEFVATSVRGDILQGEINVTEDSYFTLTIPYDEGFTITVDGEEVEYEIVNNSFIGFQISSGFHKINIEYKTPLKIESLILSIVSIFCLTGFVVVDKKYLSKEN